MSFLRWLFGPAEVNERAGRREGREPIKTITRGGVPRVAGEVFAAWQSQNLGKMLAVLDEPCHPVDRHFLLQSIVGLTYKARQSDPEKRVLCKRIGRMHVGEFQRLKEPLRQEIGTLPRVSSFQELATVLAEDGEFEEAIAVCEVAIAHGLHDGTKGGFGGRIERIRRAAERAGS